ncbi:hypothetical protein [Sporosarcina sp. G11-34]|uniref:hypothetical protein n=1 Tax=Sporosarcina sp. G11-34 TaxID=2849605 RepID=UPI0022A93157|nr:hypothetical protein [Sporosarcina sp. G11-34]MCZ2260513.1 hypothetical protein [Sporosarcina sp. G11-34]
MKKLFYVLGIAMILLVAAGCGDIDEKNDREVSSAQGASKEVSEEVEEEEVEEKEKAVGVRSNPLPFGDTITVKENIYDDSFNAYDSSFDITLLEVIRGEEAWKVIEEENPYNEPAEEGYEYVLVKAKGVLTESETEDDFLWASSMNFDFVSSGGEVYDSVSVVTPKEFEKELYNGGTVEGYISGQVKTGDDFKVSYNSSEGSPVFFNVE